jgi:hypothetical protein
MSDPLGIRRLRVRAPDGARIEHVILQRPLHRVLAFTRRTIDDVINDPIARNQVRAYFKLHKWVQRASEISELERQWNNI